MQISALYRIRASIVPVCSDDAALATRRFITHEYLDRSRGSAARSGSHDPCQSAEVVKRTFAVEIFFHFDSQSWVRCGFVIGFRLL